MKAKKILAMALAGIMMFSVGACGGSTSGEAAANPAETATDVADMLNTEVATDAEDAQLDYTYGEDVTFHSDEPVTYSMMYSDHENYPYKEDWRLWSAIQEKTNVTFDLTIIARTDYEDKKSVLINSGDSPYIIPKTYDEGKYVNGGQIVAISDWVKLCPITRNV